MTTTDLAKLTPEEKRVKIAEKCQRPELEAWLLDERLAYFAMHEAEQTLTEKQRTQYVIQLLSLNYWKATDAQADFRFASSTAAQRADAFLLTI